MASSGTAYGSTSQPGAEPAVKGSLQRNSVDMPEHAAEAKEGHHKEHGNHELEWMGSGGLCHKPRLVVDWKNSEAFSAAVRNQEVGDERHVSWAELFFDLIYVTAIARLGENLRGDDELVAIPFRDYAAMFLSIYNLWIMTTQYATRFFQDDLFHKVWLGLMQMGVVMLAVHVRGGLAGPSGSIYCYSLAGIMVILAAPNFPVWWYVEKYRTSTLVTMGMQLACFVLVVIGGSSAVEPSQRWVWVLAYSLVLPSYLLQVVVKRFGILPYDLPRPPPLDLEHYVERVGLFMIIVLGETINGISLSVKEYPRSFYLSAVYGFIATFSQKLLYFDVDPKGLDEHAARVDMRRGVTWSYTHIILFGVTALVGSGIAMICALEGGAGEDYEHPELARLYMAQGFGTMLICLSVVRMMHLPPGNHLPEQFGASVKRLAYIADFVQVACGAFTILLPTLWTEEEVDNVTIVGICAGITILNASFNIMVRLRASRAERATDQWEAEQKKGGAEAAETSEEPPKPRVRRHSQYRQPAMDAVHLRMTPRRMSADGTGADESLLPAVRGRRAVTHHA